MPCGLRRRQHRKKNLMFVPVLMVKRTESIHAKDREPKSIPDGCPVGRNGSQIEPTRLEYES